MKTITFITHADIIINRAIPVPDWSLSERGKRRHQHFNQTNQISDVTSIYCSDEKKAKDGAEILAKHVGVKHCIVQDLHENDRSATGFLEPDEFQQVADQFFAQPKMSVRGWETAIDAQLRIVNCVKNIIDLNRDQGDIAIISHGGVGALLLCYILNEQISREFDQPANGGGNYFCFDEGWQMISQWSSISEGMDP